MNQPESSIHEPDFMPIHYEEQEDGQMSQEIVVCRTCGDLFIIFHNVLKPARIYPLRRDTQGAMKMLGYIIVGTPDERTRRHRWPEAPNYVF